MRPTSPAPGRPESTSDRAAAKPYELDAQAIARLAELDPGGDGQLVQRVLRAYAASLDRLMGDFRQARAAQQLADLRRAAHTLKSSSASVGALQLAALCSRFEQAALEPCDVNNGDILDSLEVEAARVAVAVRAMLHR
jgi:HPt (histidine-containing phosphotransfer) domain-containing protein